MKAAVLREVGKPLEIEEVEIRKPKSREVLIRTAATGVCHSDVHFVRGAYPAELPIVLGHESAGIVEQVGNDVTYVKPGDHVITCLSVFCGYCEPCITGHMSICENPDVKGPEASRGRLHKGDEHISQFANLSSFAEQMLVHEHALVKIREDFPLDRGALIGCGVMTGVGAVFHTAKVEPGSTVAVVGCGGVGLSAVNGAAIAGAGKIIAIDLVGSKLNLAKQFGATHTVDASSEDPVRAVRELTGGGVHFSFEAIGNKTAAEQCFRMLRPGGTATVIGMIPVGTSIELHGPEFLREKKIQGSSMGSNHFRVDMPRLIDFYLDGKLHLDELISERIKLHQVNEAMDELERGELARSVIIFD
ncbi:MAG: Zn-dependent alcohol dehydrogenase [Chromatiales bacterium]|jgi:S-(hydroxymethyl)glutathione dehydrogenase / alcohol dehydrogenase|nr:Zn-dependent alcohol dehydrogenase [Chromatiales bacterium]